MPYAIEDRAAQSAARTAEAQPESDTGILRYRRSEGYAPFFRSDRYFTVGHEWYVTKREGGHLGPYLSADEAEYALAKHVAVLLDLAGEAESLLDRGREEPLTPFERRVCTVLERWRAGVRRGAGDPPPAEAPSAGVANAK